jgi:hypothetical protein
MTILADHDIEGQTLLLLGTLAAQGWLDLISLSAVTFGEVGLRANCTDRQIWRFAQEQQMILLTGNRNMKGHDSLERTIREENTPACLPVLTISDVSRVDESSYRQRCAARLLEILVDIEQYRGVGRLFIP